MISTTLYREQIRMQYYFFFVVLCLYQLLEGIYNTSYVLDVKKVDVVGWEFYLDQLVDYNTAVTSSMTFFLFLMVGLVMIQFWQMRKEENIQFYGKLPIERKTLLITTYLSGLTVLGVGYFIHVLAVVIQNAGNKGIWDVVIWQFLAQGIFLLTFYTVLFFMEILCSKNSSFVWLCICSSTVLGFDILNTYLIWIDSSMGGYHFFTPLDYIESYPILTLESELPIAYWIFYTLMSVAGMILSALLLWLSIKVYIKTDSANIFTVFTVPIPGWACAFCGLLTGYASVHVIVLIANFVYYQIRIFAEIFGFSIMELSVGQGWRLPVSGLLAMIGMLLFVYLKQMRMKKEVWV